MKVLLLGPDFSSTGGVQYVGRLILAALRSSFGAELEICAIGLNDRRVPRPDIPERLWRVCNGSKLSFVTAVASEVKDGYDLILANHINLLPLIAAATFPRAPRLMVLVHGIEAWTKLPRWKLAAFRKVQRLIYVSEHCRRMSEHHNPMLSTIDSTICHHGLLPDDSVVSALRERRYSERFVLMLGRIASAERYKGHAEMIHAWPQVRRHQPDLELWIAGDGDDRPRLEALAARACPSIRFLGAVNDTEKEALLDECECFSMPSRGEGFGLVYLEAMRAAKPILAGRFDAGSEVIVDGVTGRVVDPSDRDAIAQAILELASDKGAEMGIAGRASFQTQFAFEHYVDRFRRSIQPLAVPSIEMYTCPR